MYKWIMNNRYAIVSADMKQFDLFEQSLPL